MNQYKALMAGFAAVIGLGGIASYNGVFSGSDAVTQESTANSQPAAAVSTTEPAKVEPAQTEVAKVDPAATTPEATAEPEKSDAATAAEPAAPATETVATAVAQPEKSDAATATEPAAPAVEPAMAAVAPTFDVLRVEPNGSVLIAGKAAKDAQVDILSGATSLGTTKAQANGDFVIVIETPLKPGDYQLVLRQTMPDGTSATSVETATVAVPEKPDGPVLALVEEPGKPSRIITAPSTAEVAMQTQVTAPAATTTETAAADPAKPADPQATETAAPDNTQAATQPETPAAVADGSVNIEAVETEGNKVFVAGSAKGVASVRVYANDTILGESKALPGDRFLVEVQKDMAAGDYIIKAEGLAADGVTVLGSAMVPFKAGGSDQVAAASSDPQAANTTAQTDTGAAPEKKMAVIIRRGDTLWQISRRIYGRGVRYSTIYLANKDAINNPNRIFPGQVVAIPDSTPEGEAANAEEIKKRENAE